MLSNNIWPVLTDFREKKQLFIDSSFTLLTVSFLTSWDVKVVIYDLLLPDPVRKATSSRSSLRYIASPPFISFIEQPLCLGRALSHHRPQLLFSVQSLCSLERNWVACFISFPRIFVPTISSPQENDTSSKLKIFHQMKDYMSASNLSSATSIGDTLCCCHFTKFHMLGVGKFFDLSKICALSFHIHTRCIHPVVDY